MKLFLIGVGGAFGSVARYLLEGWVQRLATTGFPFGILAVNTLGSFLIGFALIVLEARGWLDSTLRLALVTGVLGGFTTYSSFNYQTLEFLRAGDWTRGLLNLTATVGLCLAAGVLGLGAGRWLTALA